MTDAKQPEALRLADKLLFAGRFAYESEDVAARRRINRNSQAAAELCRLHEQNQLLIAANRALKAVFPNNLNAINKNVPDTTVIPLDFTYGELKKIAAAIAKAEVEK